LSREAKGAIALELAHAPEVVEGKD
jgi:hypothetical protein